MAALTRLFSLCSWFGSWALVAALLVAVLAATPELAVLAAVALVVALWRGGGIPRLWHGNIFGDARWADAGDALRAGMTEPGGLPVGSLPPPPRKEAGRLLRAAPWFLGAAACRVVAAANRKQPVPVFLHDWVNLAVVAPPGVGKTTAIIIPAVLSLPWSSVILDVKAEITEATRRRRMAMGSRVEVLDPFGITQFESARLNPIGWLRHTDPNVTDDARAIAESLVTRTGMEHDPHWADSAVVVLTCVILYLVWRCHHTGKPEEQTLAAAFHVAANPDKLDSATEHMLTCPDHAFVLADLAAQVRGFQDKERASVISSTLRALAFTQTAKVKAATADSTFDPALLRSGFLTVYLVVPPDKLKSHAGLTRAWITTLMTAMVRAGADRHARVLWCLDEYAAIGRMEAVEAALTQYRGFGARMIFAFQTVKQMETAFPEGGSDHVLANTTALFMGVKDLPTAKLVSDCVGQHTVTKYGTSEGDNDGSSYAQEGGSRNISSGTSRNRSADSVGTELIKPSQVLQLGQRQMVVLHPGVPPMKLDTHRFYERGWERVFTRLPSTSGLLLRSLLTCAAVYAALAAVVAVGIPAGVKAAAEYRERATRMHNGQGQQGAGPDPDAELRANPLVVKDAFGNVARHPNGQPVLIPPGWHVEWHPQTGTAFLVRNGDRMFR